MTALTQASHATSRLHSNERNQSRNEPHDLTPVVSQLVLHDATSDIRHLSAGSAGKSLLLRNAHHQSSGPSSRSLIFPRFRVSMQHTSTASSRVHCHRIDCLVARIWRIWPRLSNLSIERLLECRLTSQSNDCSTSLTVAF
jgi:hypothetical protein